jgi:hypothetical protein
MSDKWFQHTTQNNQRQQDWRNLPRDSKLARVLYPALADDDTRKAQASFSASEGKRPPQGAKLLSDRTRGCVSPLGNVAKQSGRR